MHEASGAAAAAAAAGRAGGEGRRLLKFLATLPLSGKRMRGQSHAAAAVRTTRNVLFAG